MLDFAGLGLHIKGGQPVPTHNGVIGAFVQEIRQGSVAAQLLGELKPGEHFLLNADYLRITALYK